MKHFFTFVAIAFTLTNIYSQTQALADTSLELTGGGGTQWVSTSTNFGTVICDAGTCGNCGGPCVSHSGAFFGWFGGTASLEIGTLTQTFNLVTGGTGTLSFWLMIPNAGVAADSLVVAIDGTEVFAHMGDDTVGFDATYAQVVVSIGSSLASGPHTLFIGAKTGPGANACNILVDDITLTISGSSGTESVLLDENIHLFYNAMENNLNMNFNLSEPSDMAVSVIDMNGRIVMAKTYSNMQHETVTVNTTGMATGFYTVNFVKGNHSAIAKKIYIQQ